MSNAETNASAFVDQAADLLGIEIDPTIREAVVANFRNLAGYFTALEGFEEPDVPDPPAVFRP